ncbi:MAG: HdeD family acid-resistance protein [Rhodobiaceae bacterium]|nr:HdeD family acid-resistance protein [Rhodobiaceae bacterium]MCC0057019.1 HdeD family acid-resistance protein [Rhodobiaceae bacterium]
MSNMEAHHGHPPLLHALAANWWLLLLRGIAAVLFGVLSFFWPGITVLTLTLIWGAYALMDGIFAIGAALSGKGRQIAPRWWLAVVGIAGILAGLVAFFAPGVTAFVLLMCLAAWSIVTGIMQIIGAIRLRKEIEGELWLALSGVFSILFGAVLIAAPGAGLVTVVWIIAIFAIVFGIANIALAFRLRSHNR